MKTILVVQKNKEEALKTKSILEERYYFSKSVGYHPIALYVIL